MPARIASAWSLTEERAASSSQGWRCHARKGSLPPLLRFSARRLRAAFANSANTSGSFPSERLNTSSADLQGRGIVAGCSGAVSRALNSSPIHSLSFPICARISRIRRFAFWIFRFSRLSRWLCLSSPFDRRLRPCGR